jgi:hypothetical protein
VIEAFMVIRLHKAAINLSIDRLLAFAIT